MARHIHIHFHDSTPRRFFRDSEELHEFDATAKGYATRLAKETSNWTDCYETAKNQIRPYMTDRGWNEFLKFMEKEHDRIWGKRATYR